MNRLSMRVYTFFTIALILLGAVVVTLLILRDQVVAAGLYIGIALALISLLMIVLAGYYTFSRELHKRSMRLLEQKRIKQEIDDREKAAQRELERLELARLEAENRHQAEMAITYVKYLEVRAKYEEVRYRAQIEERRTLVPQGHTVVFDEGYGSREYSVIQGMSAHHPTQLASGTQDALTGDGRQEYPLPKIEVFYELIPYNSLQVGLGIESATGKPVIAAIPKSTHFKFIGGSGQGKSCVAAGVLDIATTTNDPNHLRIGLLDLEHNTSRLFEDLPHVAEIGPRRQRLVGRDPDEVANKLKLLQWELTRRAQLGEEYCTQNEPILLVYVEEMLSLKYEVVDKQLQKDMLAAINILGIRGRKYGIFFLTCMQTDYSDKSTREAMAQFRTRGGFAIDPDTARASGFFNTALIKQNFQVGRQGQYVLERPQYGALVLAPDYDVALKLEAKSKKATTRATTVPTIEGTISHYESRETPAYEVASVPTTLTRKQPTTGALHAPLTAQEWRIIEKWREGMGMKQIIASEFSNGKGEPLTGGDLFTQKAKEIQQLICRFLPKSE